MQLAAIQELVKEHGRRSLSTSGMRSEAAQPESRPAPVDNSTAAASAAQQSPLKSGEPEQTAAPLNESQGEIAGKGPEQQTGASQSESQPAQAQDPKQQGPQPSALSQTGGILSGAGSQRPLGQGVSQDSAKSMGALLMAGSEQEAAGSSRQGSGPSIGQSRYSALSASLVPASSISPLCSMSGKAMKCAVLQSVMLSILPASKRFFSRIISSMLLRVVVHPCRSGSAPTEQGGSSAGGLEPADSAWPGNGSMSNAFLLLVNNSRKVIGLRPRAGKRQLSSSGNLSSATSSIVEADEAPAGEAPAAKAAAIEPAKRRSIFGNRGVSKD